MYKSYFKLLGMKNSVGCVFIVLRTKNKRVHAMLSITFYSTKNSIYLLKTKIFKFFFRRHITFHVVSTSKNNKNHIIYRLRRLGTTVTWGNIYCNTSNIIYTLSVFIPPWSIQKCQQKITYIVF